MAQQAHNPNNYQRGRAAVPAWHGTPQPGGPPVDGTRPYPTVDAWQPSPGGAPAAETAPVGRRAHPVRAGLRPGRGTGPLSRLGTGRKAAAIAGGGALVVLLCCGGLTVVGALAGDPQQGRPASDEQPVAQPAPTEAASAAGTAAPATAPATAPPTTPAVVARTVTETRAIPFRTRTVTDPTLAKGTKRVRTPGVAGVKTLSYRVTYTGGVETGRTLIRETVTRQPVTKVVAVGTKTSKPTCDPNYSGCVPIASDVDCAGGGGNGPAYVSGVVKVTGSDIYDLDRDNDGYGCD